VWLRLAHFSGCFTADGYVAEQRRVVRLLDERLARPEDAYLRVFRDAWRALKARTGQLGDGVFTDEETR